MGRVLEGLKGLTLRYFPDPLGSEVWHPICKQAARAEKKLKVSKLVDPRPALLLCYFLPQVKGAVLWDRVSIP